MILYMQPILLVLLVILCINISVRYTEIFVKECLYSKYEYLSKKEKYIVQIANLTIALSWFYLFYINFNELIK